MATEPRFIQAPWPFQTCPSCRSDQFAVFDEHATAVFTCLGCGSRWRYMLGYLILLDDLQPDNASPAGPDQGGANGASPPRPPVGHQSP